MKVKTLKTDGGRDAEHVSFFVFVVCEIVMHIYRSYALPENLRIYMSQRG
jgi:hypothetical protein